MLSSSSSSSVTSSSESHELYVLPPDEELLDLFPFEPSGFYLTNIHEHGHPDVCFDEEAEREQHLSELTAWLDHIVCSRNCTLDDAIKFALTVPIGDTTVPENKLTYSSPIITPPPEMTKSQGKEEESLFPPASADQGKFYVNYVSNLPKPEAALTEEQLKTFEDPHWAEEEAKAHLASQSKQNRKFVFQNQRILLTYKSHINKDLLRNFIREKSFPTAVVDIAHENGDTVVPYPHTHAVVDFGSRFQSQDVRVFDYENIHPHFRPISNISQYKKAKHYLSKEDPECAYLFDPNAGTTLAQRVWSCKNTEEVLRTFVTSPSDVSGLLQLYNQKNLNMGNLSYVEPVYPWQKDILSYVETPCPVGNRSVTWIYDSKGNAGKSQFCRYLCITQPHLWYVIGGIVSTRDIATIISNARSSGWTGHGIIFDIPRVESQRDMDGRRDFSELMKAIELIKNGMITASKYSGHSVLFNTGWVIVMSNGLPNVDELSIDKWDIRSIDYETKSFTRIAPEEVKSLKATLISRDNPSDGSTTSGLFPV